MRALHHNGAFGILLLPNIHKKIRGKIGVIRTPLGVNNAFTTKLLNFTKLPSE